MQREKITKLTSNTHRSSKWKKKVIRWLPFISLTISVIFTYTLYSFNRDWSSFHYNIREAEISSMSIPDEKKVGSKDDRSLFNVKKLPKSNSGLNTNDTNAVNFMKLVPSDDVSITTTEINKENEAEEVDVFEDESSDENLEETEEEDESEEEAKADFVLDAKHKFKKQIKTQGRMPLSGYAKPFNLENYSLPGLEEVEGLYGDKVVIHGLDQCKAYRDKVPDRLRYIAPAGLHNTGTNALYKLLQRNCYIPERWTGRSKSNKSSAPFTPEMEAMYDCFTPACQKDLLEYDVATGIREMVPWWKHAPPSWRENPPYVLSGIRDSKEGQAYDRINALPIVMIKDPVNWMSSMCRNQYEVKFYRPMGQKCPKLVPVQLPKSSKMKYVVRRKIPATIIPPRPKGNKKKLILTYDSILDMWGQYYNEWINASFPNLIVRYEDFLFHPKEVITQVCQCAGGKMREDGSFRLMERSSKVHGNGILGPNSRTGLSAAVVMYGTKEIRDSVLESDDKIFARKNVNPIVMETFHYPPP